MFREFQGQLNDVTSTRQPWRAKSQTRTYAASCRSFFQMLTQTCNSRKRDQHCIQVTWVWHENLARFQNLEHQISKVYIFFRYNFVCVYNNKSLIHDTRKIKKNISKLRKEEIRFSPKTALGCQKSRPNLPIQGFILVPHRTCNFTIILVVLFYFGR